MWFSPTSPERPQRRFTHPVAVVAYVALLVVGIGVPAATAVTAQLGVGVVHTRNIANFAVTNAKLADMSVGRAKMRDGAIQTRSLVDGAVTTRTIRDGAVTGAKIAANTITAANINLTTLPFGRKIGPFRNFRRVAVHSGTLFNPTSPQHIGTYNQPANSIAIPSGNALVDFHHLASTCTTRTVRVEVWNGNPEVTTSALIAAGESTQPGNQRPPADENPVEVPLAFTSEDFSTLGAARLTHRLYARAIGTCAEPTVAISRIVGYVDEVTVSFSQWGGGAVAGG